MVSGLFEAGPMVATIFVRDIELNEQRLEDRDSVGLVLLDLSLPLSDSGENGDVFNSHSLVYYLYPDRNPVV